MNIYIFLGIVFVVVFFIVVIVLPESNSVRAEEARQAEKDRAVQTAHEQGRVAIEAWCKRVMAAKTDDEVCKEFSWADPYMTGLYARWEDYPENNLMTEARIKWDAADKSRRDRRLRAAYDKAPDLIAKATCLLSGHSKVDVAELLGVSLDDRERAIVDIVRQEVGLAEAGDAAALKRFLWFRGSFEWQYQLSSDARALLPLPEGWNDLVARLIEAPSLDYFARVDKEPPLGHVGQMAARAVREQSLMLGKLVLAYCNQEHTRGRRPYFPYREEVGNVLLREVTVMVEAIHAERGLFVSGQIAT